MEWFTEYEGTEDESHIFLELRPPSKLFKDDLTVMVTFGRRWRTAAMAELSISELKRLGETIIQFADSIESVPQTG
jgi:hypothetical protein